MALAWQTRALIIRLEIVGGGKMGGASRFPLARRWRPVFAPSRRRLLTLDFQLGIIASRAHGGGGLSEFELWSLSCNWLLGLVA